MARQQIAKKTVDQDLATVTFNFTSEGQVFVAKIADMPESIVQRLALHGLAQKLGDTYAGEVDSPYHEVREMYAQLSSGTWSDKGERGPQVGLLAEAIATLKPKEGVDHEARVAEVVAQLGDLDKSGLAELRANPRIKGEMAAIQAKRMAEKAKRLRKENVGVSLDNF